MYSKKNSNNDKSLFPWLHSYTIKYPSKVAKKFTYQKRHTVMNPKLLFLRGSKPIITSTPNFEAERGVFLSVIPAVAFCQEP